MSHSDIAQIRAAGIVGAGLMNHGIARVFALKGFKVKLFDNVVNGLTREQKK